MALGLGRVGAWSRGLRYNADRAAAHAAVAELEALGYGAAWLPDTGGDVLGDVHGPVVGERYGRPLTKMRDYLDALDAADPPVAADRRVLAALGPRMLELARDRAGGAHPYLVTPEHTRRAREILGPDRALAVEQSVDLGGGLERARAFVADYLRLPNYVSNLERLGYGEDDLRGSDRLACDLVAFGDEQAIASRVEGHFDAGADHVCIQVIGM